MNQILELNNPQRCWYAIKQKNQHKQQQQQLAIFKIIFEHVTS